MSSRSRIRHGEGDVLQLRVELEGVTPIVWRRLLVSSRASLHELHDVIERAMGREADDGYQFEVDGVRYLDRDADPPPGRTTDSTALASLALHPGARFVHIAENHGEPWQHVVTVELASPRLVGQRLPSCMAAAGAAPPDDCTGPAAYRELLAAFADPMHPRSAELRSWLPEHFDPAYADMPAINAALSRVRKHRPAA